MRSPFSLTMPQAKEALFRGLLPGVEVVETCGLFLLGAQWIYKTFWKLFVRRGKRLDLPIGKINWDNMLREADQVSRARLLATAQKESEAWLNAVPVSSLVQCWPLPKVFSNE